MSAFLNSVKADLLDVRLRLAVLILAIALVAGVAYAVLGGGSSSTTTPNFSRPISTGSGGIPITQAPIGPQQPLAETTNGSSQQRGGASRDPFKPLPAPVSTTAAATTAVSPSKGATTSPASQGAVTKTLAAPSKPSTRAKTKAPVPVYHVAVLFGVAAPGTPPQNLHLTPYENLRRLEPLPSSKQPLLVFRGVTAGGASATFTLIGEAILHGGATCLPSPSQCQDIELKPKQTEELEYLSTSGQAVTYRLQLVSIASSKASAAKAARVFHSQSRAGRELLRRAGLIVLPGLQYSFRRGVLVAPARAASSARARAAARRRARAAAWRERPER
jgi:hypothetical protein